VLIHYARRPVSALAPGVVELAKPFAAPDLWETMVQAIAGRGGGFAEQSSLLNAVPEGYGARVLVAEDDRINAKLMDSLLRKAGHEVVLVRDGERALQAARSRPFDLALVDLRMPRMDGLEFTRRYRAQEEGGRLPIVALTANAAEDAHSECLAAGMDDFLTKPVDPDLLDALLRRYRRDLRAG
jgi:CheY-like chemotaxis protein